MKHRNLFKLAIAPISIAALLGCKSSDGKVTVTFRNYDYTTLYTERIESGKDITYKGPLPVKEALTGEACNVFTGWTKPLTNIKQDTVITAKFKRIDTYIDKDHDGIPLGVDTDDNNNYFEVGAKSFVYLNQNIKIDFSKFLVDKANTKYDNEIAKLGLFMSNPKIDFKDGLFSNEVYGGRVNALYSRIGCDDFHEFSFKENNYQFDKHDSTSGVIGHKYLYNDDGSIAKDMIIIAFNGTGGKDGWYSNFDIGYDGESYYSKTGGIESHPEWDKKEYHKGFYIASRRVMSNTGPVKFLDYIDKHSSKSNGKPIIFVTGHSRGGAMAELIGEYLELNYKKDTGKDCIPFTYSFASPSVVNNNYIDKTQTIFNIINEDDLVTMVPHVNWGFKRIGQTAISESIIKQEDYLADYNKNVDKREYAVVDDAERILGDIGCEREHVYEIGHAGDDDLAYFTEIGEYNTEDEAKSDIENQMDLYRKELGYNFCRYFTLVPYGSDLLGWTLMPQNCFAIIPCIVQNIMLSTEEFISKSPTWLGLITNLKYDWFVLELVPSLIAGGTDAIALPHDYGAYHVILNKYQPK